MAKGKRKNIFTDVQMTSQQSNTFDLSHDRKMSLQMGRLVPISVMEVVPGDKFKISTSQLLRFSPLIAPVMHQVNVYTHFFFCPNRIVWDGWEDFITGGEDGTDTTVHPFNTVLGNVIGVGTLGDYMGIPNSTNAGSIDYSPIIFGAYQKIYDDCYRDENQIAKATWSIIDGDNTANIDLKSLVESAPLRRAWQHDYFTSALPWTQRGAIATIPLGTSAPIVQIATDTTSATKVTRANLTALPAGTVNISRQNAELWDGTDRLRITGDGIEADLSSATASSIIDLRNAFKLQEWLEKNARGGSRYTEQILSHFGVRSSDKRLGRPEYLGGGKSNIVISEVLQTSETNTTPQGNLGGHGLGVGRSNTFNKFFEEHGWVIGIMSVVPRTAYQEGLHRKFTRFDKFDHYWPEFAHIGEQEVKVGELYHKYTGAATHTDTFGYQSRNADYKYGCDTVHGDFRETLDFWHMGRIFLPNDPTLNTSFVESNPTHRIFANTDPADDKLWIQLYNRISAIRPMPYFSNPKF